MNIQTYRKQKEEDRLKILRRKKAELRLGAKHYLEEQGIVPDVVDKLEAYIAGDEAWLSAVPDIPPRGLLNDLETLPYPVIMCNLDKGIYSFTDAGKEYFHL